MDYLQLILIVVFSLTACLCLMAYYTIVLKTSKTHLDMVIAHTFANEVLHSIVALVVYAMLLYEYQEAFSLMNNVIMFFRFNVMSFVFLSCCVQNIAICYPLKLRRWATPGRLRVYIFTSYVLSMTLQAILFTLKTQGMLSTETIIHVNFGILGVFLPVLMQVNIRSFARFAQIRENRRLTTPKKSSSSDQTEISESHVHGKQNSFKTMCVLGVMALGSVIGYSCIVLGHFGIRSQYGLLFFQLQWVLISSLYLVANKKTWWTRTAKNSLPKRTLSQTSTNISITEL